MNGIDNDVLIVNDVDDGNDEKEKVNEVKDVDVDVDVDVDGDLGSVLLFLAHGPLLQHNGS